MDKNDRGIVCMLSRKKGVVAMLLAVALMLTPQVSAATKSSISIAATKVNVVVGQSIVLSAKTVNGKGYPVVWTTNRSAVATVVNGKVNAIGAGTAIITATIPKLKLKSNAVAVTVTKKVYANAQAVFAQVNKSIVYIEAYNKYNKPVSTGSGIIVGANGQVVTNYHVVTDYSEITKVKVKLATGESFDSTKALGFDVDKDLVLLKLDTTRTNLPAATLGDSAAVATGEKVYALGSPSGVQNTITEGIVSNKNVVMDKKNYIQTSAPLSPGSSGGALVNKYGEVVGINDMTLTEGQNMNYAIPVNVYKAMPKNKNVTLLQVNKAYYVAAAGTGDVTEEENNDTSDYGDKIPYADARAYGKISSNKDVDYYYFVVTSNTDVSIYGVFKTATLTPDMKITIIDDETGDYLESTIVLDDQSNTYYPSIDTTVSPGSYSIKVEVKPGSTNTFTNENYGMKLDLTPVK
jgi:serine protease Do